MQDTIFEVYFTTSKHTLPPVPKQTRDSRTAAMRCANLSCPKGYTPAIYRTGLDNSGNLETTRIL